jgi:hypothetical protein
MPASTNGIAWFVSPAATGPSGAPPKRCLFTLRKPASRTAPGGKKDRNAPESHASDKLSGRDEVLPCCHAFVRRLVMAHNPKPLVVRDEKKTAAVVASDGSHSRET